SEEIDERQKGLVLFGDWLRAEAHRLTSNSLKHFTVMLNLAPKDGMPTWLWDNLAVHVLVGGRPEVREAIVNALRVYKLLEFPTLDSLSESDLRRLASATVLMPKRATEEPSRSESPKKEIKPDEEETPATRTAAGLKKIARIQRASDELAQHLR